jgi:hypothetical protein
MVERVIHVLPHKGRGCALGAAQFVARNALGGALGLANATAAARELGKLSR